MTVYEEIKQKCEMLGISISSVCMDAKVDRQIVERWKKSDPKSIDIYKRLIAVLDTKISALDENTSALDENNNNQKTEKC